jgi:hypothetical protein
LILWIAAADIEIEEVANKDVNQNEKLGPGIDCR